MAIPSEHGFEIIIDKHKDLINYWSQVMVIHDAVIRLEQTTSSVLDVMKSIDNPKLISVYGNTTHWNFIKSLESIAKSYEDEVSYLIHDIEDIECEIAAIFHTLEEPEDGEEPVDWTSKLAIEARNTEYDIPLPNYSSNEEFEKYRSIRDSYNVFGLEVLNPTMHNIHEMVYEASKILGVEFVEKVGSD